MACSSPGFREAAGRIASGGEALASSAEVAAGIKQALEIGITEGAEALSARDGYFKSPYKILLPPEAQIVANRLRSVPGFTSVE